jgi:putative aminopeptidase FrvX
MNNLQHLLERLSNAHGVSGYEGSVRQVVEEEVKPYVDEIRTDKMGNLITTKRAGSPVVMLAAHMDEVGLMTKYVDERGFVHFKKTG